MPEKSRSSAPGKAQSKPAEDSRRSWRVRGALQDYRILRGSDLTDEEHKQAVPAMNLVANLGRWLSSVATLRVLREMHELQTGTRLSGLLQDRTTSELLRQSLAEAFKNKLLVALPPAPCAS